MPEYYIIRHTQPNIAQGVCYGATDLTLADSFETEFLHIIKTLPPDIFAQQTEKPMPIYSSPLQRCAILAHKLAENLPSKHVHFDARLQEMNFGDWEMKEWTGIPEDSWKIWKNDWVNMPAPNGESQQMVFDRAVTSVQEIMAHNPNGAFIVTHYGVMVNILAHFFEIPLKNAFRHEFTFGAILKITQKGDDYFKIKILKS